MRKGEREWQVIRLRATGEFSAPDRHPDKAGLKAARWELTPLMRQSGSWCGYANDTRPSGGDGWRHESSWTDFCVISPNSSALVQRSF
jgi:hypothetical protein